VINCSQYLIRILELNGELNGDFRWYCKAKGFQAICCVLVGFHAKAQRIRKGAKGDLNWRLGGSFAPWRETLPFFLVTVFHIRTDSLAIHNIYSMNLSRILLLTNPD
jgi:hypothetical protein